MLADTPTSGREIPSEDAPGRARSELLFVSTVIPKLSGSGVAMRAGTQLLVLTERFSVTLALALDDVAEETAREEIPLELQRACSSILIVSRSGVFYRVMRATRSRQLRLLWEMAWPAPAGVARARTPLQDVAARLAGRRFDVVHVFRLKGAHILQVLRRYKASYSRAVLDLDDYESFAAKRLAKNLRRDIGFQYAILRNLEAFKWFRVERSQVPQFDDVYVCSEADRTALQQRFSSLRFHVVPNVLPDQELRYRTERDGFTFLFVGRLDYGPNRDAAVSLCRDIVPHLRKAGEDSAKVLVVGRNPDSALKELALRSGVELTGDAPDVGPYYAAANVAVVPLRAGGGTRIKILEAFSYGVPVVSTSIGAEGIEVLPGENILIADEPERFANQCIRLMSDRTLRENLGRAGKELFRRKYTVGALRTALDVAYAAAPLREFSAARSSRA